LGFIANEISLKSVVLPNSTASPSIEIINYSILDAKIAL
jgi:hypothetical protein